MDLSIISSSFEMVTVVRGLNNENCIQPIPRPQYTDKAEMRSLKM